MTQSTKINWKTAQNPSSALTFQCGECNTSEHGRQLPTSACPTQNAILSNSSSPHTLRLINYVSIIIHGNEHISRVAKKQTRALHMRHHTSLTFLAATSAKIELRKTQETESESVVAESHRPWDMNAKRQHVHPSTFGYSRPRRRAEALNFRCFYPLQNNASTQNTASSVTKFLATRYL